MKPIEERAIKQDRPLAISLIAKLLNVSRVTVYRMLADGRLKGRHISDVMDAKVKNIWKLK